VLVPQLDALAVEFILKALRELGLELKARRSFTPDELMRELPVAEQHRRLLGRLVEILSHSGHLEKVGDRWEVCTEPPPEAPLTRCAEVRRRHPECAAELELFVGCGENLARALRGEVSVLELIFPSGSLANAERLYFDSPFARGANRLARAAVEAALRGLPAGRQLRVLEIGAGTGGLTGHVLPLLPADRTQFTFTDVAHHFLAKAREKFHAFPFVEYRLFDIERSPDEQDFARHQFDLILASNCLHATRELRQTLGHVRQLLAPHGMLVLVEGSRPTAWIDLVFGLTSGWWSFADADRRPDHPLLPPAAWQQLLLESGFIDAETVGGEEPADDSLFAQSIIVGRGPGQGVNREETQRPPRKWLILADRGGTAQRLLEAMHAAGEDGTLARPTQNPGPVDANRPRADSPPAAHDADLLNEFLVAADPAPHGVIDLRALDAVLAEDASAHDLAEIERRACGGALHLAQVLTNLNGAAPPSLIVATRRAQPAGGDAADLSLAQATLWGLGKVVALEHPELRTRLVDLGTDGERSDAGHLLAEMLGSDDERMAAYRDGARLVPRLIRSRSAYRGRNERRVVPHDRPFQLVIERRGSIDGLQVKPASVSSPGPGEVQIRVRATGLNFRDVLDALGMYPGDAGPLGVECSGQVLAVGEGVAAVAVGDDVVAVGSGSFGTFMTTRAALVAPKPASLSHSEAATLPIAFLTAHLGLRIHGRIQRGDRVLIHAATGGVGLATVQLARLDGAEIFATAGSERKREYLRSIGIRHVMDSRSLAFADQIMEITGGEGVDIVLNSLAEEFVGKSMGALRRGGRFIEIGKRGIWSARQAAEFRRDVTYEILDLMEIIKDQPETLRPVLAQVIGAAAAGTLQPLPLRAFPVEEVVSAFSHMQRARHIGKIVVTQPAWGVGWPIDSTDAFAGEGTWLLTGGFGGVGLCVARWLADRGARHLIVCGRSKPTEEAQADIADLEKVGVKILSAQCDIARENDVKELLEQTQATMPRLRGVFHLAGVLDDGVLGQQNWERFATVFGPKVLGAWNLHRFTEGMALDCFVLFSSFAGLLGSPGQSNHSAANSFLDALAWHRRAAGLPALSVNWGAWAEVGAAAQGDIAERLGRLGIRSFSPAQGLEALGRLMSEGTPQAAVTPLEWSIRQRAYPAAESRLFEFIQDEGRAPGPENGGPRVDGNLSLRDVLRETQAGPARRQAIEAHLLDLLVRVLGLSAHRLDSKKSFKDLGLDSLTALELRNRLEASTGQKLPATAFWNYPTVAALAAELAVLMGLPLDKDDKATDPPSPRVGLTTTGREDSELSALLDDIAGLSDEDLRRLIGEPPAMEGRS
jgi:NADPH:quinone reductase-like Zn-dependent oxidoreductase/SAM-dependent methyltransferase/acyl carrier protein